jgi:CDP-diacylglycerol--serine O-phosphatidyltransferase
MYLGFSAIILLINGNPLQASWLVFIAAILDTFDGKLARLLSIESTFGTEFDSFADTVSFCTTSSLLIYTTWAVGMNPILAIVVSFTPILFGTIRLAKFNVFNDDSSPNYTGVTTPLYANLLFGYVLFSNYLFGDFGDPRIGIILAIVVGLLMLSRLELGKVPFLSLKKGLKNNIRLFSSIALLVCIIVWKGLIIFPMLFAYLMWSILKTMIRNNKIDLVERLKPNRN